MDSEIWKPIQVQGFEGLYLISNLGNVWSVRKNKNLKYGINGGGYKFVVLSAIIECMPKTHSFNHEAINIIASRIKELKK